MWPNDLRLSRMVAALAEWWGRPGDGGRINEPANTAGAENPICVTCGVQYSGTPDACRICTDERQYVGWNGQQWTSLTEMHQAGYRNRIEEVEPGLWGIGTEPRFGIGQRALLVRTEHGNMLWDCISYVDDETIDRIGEIGGVQAISASHPHFYGSVVEWSRAFNSAPIYLPGVDQEWVCREDATYRFYQDFAAPLPAVTLIRCGGHFDGSAVLHWPAGAGGAGVLLVGDTVQVVMDRQFVSFMRSYPNLIPLGPSAIKEILTKLEPYQYDRVYGAWWQRNVDRGGQRALTESAERYIQRASEAG